ncbi:MAG: hypothetical protein IPM77_18655 [Crocinitomicaceae bacterium]|nr:hypothetical protein [Crocinitomicaceae bacterium]
MSFSIFLVALNKNPQHEQRRNQSKIKELEEEIQVVRDNGDEELVELMMMELEELKTLLKD